MGCCSSSRRAIPIYVPVPEHGSGFLHWGDVNCVRAMQYLLTWYGTATPQEKQLYTEPYCVHPPAQGPVPTMDDASAGVPVPRGGRHPAVLVTDPEGELHHVMLQLHDRLRSSKGGTPPAKYRFDVSTQVRMSADLVARRVHAALYMHLPLLIDGVQRKKVAFVGELDTAWINAHLPSRFSFTEAQMRRLVSLFNEINVTHTGGVTLHEFERWVDAHTPDDAEAESLFLDFIFLVNGRPQSPGHLNVHEFILVVHTFLTLSHEEMMEHFFSCMADTINEDGHLAINMRRIQERYPKLGRANEVQHAGNEMLMTEFKNLAESRNMMINQHLGQAQQPRKVRSKFKRGNLIHNPIRDKRFSAPVSTGFDPGRRLSRHSVGQEGALCTRRQFMELCEETHYIMGPMYMLQSMMHKKVFGLEFWTQRAHIIRQAAAGRSRPRNRFLTRSISRQQLHTQNSGYLRVGRPVEDRIVRASEAAGSHGGGADGEPEQKGEEVGAAGRRATARELRPQAEDEHFRTYVWVHRPDNSFVLREWKENHGVEDGDVANVLNEVDHDHTQLNALAGVEPLMKLGSLQNASHFPPLRPEKRQRRHTYDGNNIANVPAPMHVSPTLVPHASAPTMGGEHGSRRASFHDMTELAASGREGGKAHRHAQPVGGPRQRRYSSEAPGQYYWSGKLGASAQPDA